MLSEEILLRNVVQLNLASELRSGDLKLLRKHLLTHFHPSVWN